MNFFYHRCIIEEEFTRLLFGVTLIPVRVSSLLLLRSPNAEENYNHFWHILRMVGFCLSFANSCANPVALYCVSGAFRKHFNR